MEIRDVAIIGAGPAGITAAIQLRRYGIDPLLLEKDETGGLLRNANLVENYPGFPEGISGKRLLELFRKQLENVGAKISSEEVSMVSFKEGYFQVQSNRGVVNSRILVVASGTEPREIPNLSWDVAKQIRYDVYSLDGLTDEKIAVIGAGDLAFDYALNLSKRNEVILFNRGSEAKCLPVLFERALENKKISYKKSTQIIKIELRDDAFILTCKDSKGEHEIDAGHVVAAIGRKTNIGFLDEDLRQNMDRLQKEGLLLLIGDVKNDIYRQVAISAGDGMKAAMKIGRKLGK